MPKPNPWTSTVLLIICCTKALYRESYYILWSYESAVLIFLVCAKSQHCFSNFPLPFCLFWGCWSIKTAEQSEGITWEWWYDIQVGSCWVQAWRTEVKHGGIREGSYCSNVGCWGSAATVDLTAPYCTGNNQWHTLVQHFLILQVAVFLWLLIIVVLTFKVEAERAYHQRVLEILDQLEEEVYMLRICFIIQADLHLGLPCWKGYCEL